MRNHDWKRWITAAALPLIGILSSGCGSDDPLVIGATATATKTATSPPTRTSTVANTPTPSATVTTPLPSATATVSTPSVTATASTAPTVTFTATPSFVPGSCNDPAVQASEPLCALDNAPSACDFLIEENCLLPYPSSVFLVSDPTTATGLRLNYGPDALPATTTHKHIDPTEWNTLDGFSPGPTILALFPQGVDLAASHVATITDFARSLDDDSPTVILNAATGERVLHFVELDAQATGPATQTFIIRPGVRLREATRYIVAIRGLVNPSGQPIVARHAFQILRDGLATPVNTINARRANFEDIFSKLASAGVARGDLILAWDFTTASTQSLTGRALSLRDQGLAANGSGAPPFTVTSVEDNYSDHIFRRVRGTFTVPLFMTKATPPTTYNLDANGVPQQNGTTTAPFTITIPRSAVGGSVPQPGRALVYGHGLLGSGEGEITAGHLQQLADRFDFVVGATDWIGLSENDFTTALRVTSDLSNFRAIPDRLQQAFLNFILLGRLMTAADGLNSDPNFQFNGVPIIDSQALYYYGNSQGGIEGGAYLALSPDTTRGVLGVGAANYSILLQRSIDGLQFTFPLYQHYTNEIDRALIYPLIQQLWDRGEPQGYLSHLVADPLPGTPAKTILMQIGLHDWQVSNLASEIEVRSLGIPNVAPSALPLVGVPEMAAPIDGSAFVPYDVNGKPEPLTNTAPPGGDDNGVHEAVRRLDAAQRQIDAFLHPNGMVQNFCDGPCAFQNVPGVTPP